MNDVEVAQVILAILSKFTKAAPDEAPATPKAARVDGLDGTVAKALAQHSPVRDTSVISQVTKVANTSTGAFDTTDEVISVAVLAQVQYRHCSIQDRASLINGIHDVFLREDMSCAPPHMAVEEIDMRNYEGKLIKNRVAAPKTPGIGDLTTSAVSGDGGLTLIGYSAFGAIGSITPTTNPTETIINNSVGILAASDTVVLSPHPRLHKVSPHMVELIDSKLAQSGAPTNMVVAVTKLSIDNINALVNDPRINVLVVTDDSTVVKTVTSSGKKAIGTGAGNPSAVVDETAGAEKAARDITRDCSLDNNLSCAVEKEMIVMNQIANYLVHCMEKSGAYLLCGKKLSQQLQLLVLNEKSTGPNTAFIGKGAHYILQQSGIQVGDDIKVILIEAEKTRPFVVHELMMPVLPATRVGNVDEATGPAVKVEHGNRYTAAMYSTNVEKLTKMMRLIQTTIFAKSGPSYAGLGIGGEGRATFMITRPTGEGLASTRSFARRRRCVVARMLNIR